MASRKPGGRLRVVRRTVIVRVGGVMSVLSDGVLADPMPPDLVGRFTGWRDVLDAIGRIIPEMSVILDVLRFFLSIMTCAAA